MKMLRIFRNVINRKKRKKKRKSTQQQKLDRIDLKQREYVEKIFEEMTEKDPELKRLIVAKTFGIELPDPSIGQRQELEARLAHLAGPHALCWARPGYKDWGYNEGFSVHTPA